MIASEGQEVWQMCSPKVPRMPAGIGFEIVGSIAGLQLVGKFLVLLEVPVVAAHVEVDRRQLSFQLWEEGHGAIRLREAPIPAEKFSQVVLIDREVSREAANNPEL